MAQTTTAIPQSAYEVEVSVDGTTWTSIKGSAATVAISGGEQMVGTQHTAEGATAVVVPSHKTNPVTVTVRCLYTETAAESWKTVKARYDGAAKTIYFRYSPMGGQATEERYTAAINGAAAACPIVTCLPPDMDAGAEDPAMFEFSVLCASLLEATISA